MIKEGFLVKLLRASEHFKTLEDEITAFLKREPYLFVRETEPKRTQYRVKVVEEFPPHIAVVVGDVLQNARSSLDHLAWRLAGDNAVRATSFPIYDKRDDYFAQDRRGKPTTNSGLFKVAALPKKAQTIIETMQPYHGTDLGRTLGLLHDFARIDRHRLLHLVGGASDDFVMRAGRRNESGELVMTKEGSTGELKVRLGAFEHDTVIATITHAPDVEVECEFPVHIAMRESEPGSHFYPVLLALAGALRAVRDVAVTLGPQVLRQSKRSWADGPVTQVDVGDALMQKTAAPGTPYVARISRRRHLPPSKG